MTPLITRKATCELQMTCFSCPQVISKHRMYQLASAAIRQLCSCATLFRPAATSWLTCSLLTQLHIVSSAADCQLSCTLLVQISLSYQLNLLLELSGFSSCSVYLLLCQDKQRNGLYRHTLCSEPVQLSNVHNNKTSTIELHHLMVNMLQIAYFI